MAKAAVTVKTNLQALEKLKKSYSPGSALQKLVDSEVVRLSDPRAPSDTTALRKSAYIRTEPGSGRVIYEIYGNPEGRNTWNDETSNFQDRPMRGPFWVKRMLEAGGMEKLLSAIKAFIRGAA
jgi:hypothetical protein